MVDPPDESRDTAALSQEQALQDDRARRKRDKIRSAWISFVGRIIAQILGAVATITLGLALADRIRSDAARSAGAAGAEMAAAPASAAASRTHDARPSIAVLPLELFAADVSHRYLADSLTEEIVASLVSGSALRVVSRTSSRRYRDEPRSIPEIASSLRVQVVVEGSVQLEGDRVRIRLRAIDGARDTHIGTVVRESGIRELAAQPAAVAESAAKELTDIVLASVRP